MPLRLCRPRRTKSDGRNRLFRVLANGGRVAFAAARDAAVEYVAQFGFSLD
jgi:hypothetical protein